jgi:hypothetical protein
MRLQVLSEEDIQYLTKNDDNVVIISLYWERGTNLIYNFVDFSYTKLRQHM